MVLIPNRKKEAKGINSNAQKNKYKWLINTRKELKVMGIFTYQAGKNLRRRIKLV